LEGLEWTLQYYTNGCPDWRWKYNYEYPPLLVDLVEAIPLFDTQVLPVKQKRPVSALVQLCYVLPHSALHLLPKGIAGKLLEEHPEWYKDHCELLWAFCKYMWESHVLMEHIDVDELEKFIEKNRELIRVSV
jgi:5'-3' exonuclease